MKFNKSERTLHKNSFNPPCNVYQPTSKLDNKVVTGSLAGPSSVNRNTFGYEQRFASSNNLLPGPGDYSLRKEKNA